MGSLPYISQKSMLLRFKAARTRLMATSEKIGSLSDTRIASATEEINQISDDIRAKGATSSNRADAATPASKPADSQVVHCRRQLPSAQPWRARILKPIEQDRIREPDDDDE
jgi:hypothetical protein